MLLLVLAYPPPPSSLYSIGKPLTKIIAELAKNGSDLELILTTEEMDFKILFNTIPP